MLKTFGWLGKLLCFHLWFFFSSARVAYRLAGCTIFVSLGCLVRYTCCFGKKRTLLSSSRIGHASWVFVHDRILDFDEPVGLVCLYLGRKTYYCLVFYTILSKFLHFYCLYCTATCHVCLFAKRIRLDLLHLVYPDG